MREWTRDVSDLIKYEGDNHEIMDLIVKNKNKKVLLFKKCRYLKNNFIYNIYLCNFIYIMAWFDIVVTFLELLNSLKTL